MRQFASPAEHAAAVIGATPAGIPGLWNAPGYPELTSGQLVQIARDRLREDASHDHTWVELPEGHRVCLCGTFQRFEKDRQWHTLDTARTLEALDRLKAVMNGSDG